jgi:hypothetical protein
MPRLPKNSNKGRLRSNFECVMGRVHSPIRDLRSGRVRVFWDSAQFVFDIAHDPVNCCSCLLAIGKGMRLPQPLQKFNETFAFCRNQGRLTYYIALNLFFNPQIAVIAYKLYVNLVWLLFEESRAKI